MYDYSYLLAIYKQTIPNNLASYELIDIFALIRSSRLTVWKNDSFARLNLV